MPEFNTESEIRKRFRKSGIMSINVVVSGKYGARFRLAERYVAILLFDFFFMSAIYETPRTAGIGIGISALFLRVSCGFVGK